MIELAQLTLYTQHDRGRIIHFIQLLERVFDRLTTRYRTHYDNRE